MSTQTFTVKRHDRAFAREVMILSNAKHNTDVEEIKSFGHSTFVVTGSDYALRVLTTALASEAI